MDCNHTIGLIVTDSDKHLVYASYVTQDRKLPDIRFQFCLDCGEYLGDYLLDSVDEILANFEKEQQRKTQIEVWKTEMYEKFLADYDEVIERRTREIDQLEPPDSSMPIPPEAIAAYESQP